MSDGLDDWCYDAIEIRVFEKAGSAATTVLRSLEVIETNFDSNPAVFVTVLLSRRTIEEYLATAPAEDEAARYLRAVRTPGVTTRVELDAPSAIQWWTIDGVAPHAIPEAVPGPSSAGLSDDTPPVQRVPRWRAVVAPGSHVIRVTLSDQREVDRVIEISAGQRLVLSVPGGHMTPLEDAVMTMLLAGEGPTLEQLRRQLAVATVSSREHSGVGFFTNFEVPAELRLSFNTLQLQGVEATIAGLENGAGFVLFVSDGVIDFLECFTHGEEWPAEISDYTLRHETPQDGWRH